METATRTAPPIAGEDILPSDPWARASFKANRSAPLTTEERRVLRLGPELHRELVRAAQRVVEAALECRDLTRLLADLGELNALAHPPSRTPHVIPFGGRR